MSHSRVLYVQLSSYFFFFFFTWSSSWSLFSIWLGQEIGLNGTQISIVYAVNSILTLIIQPIYGYISDKIGLNKYILFFVSLLLLFVGPFYIYVYAPLLQHHFILGLIVGSLYLGSAFLAAIGAIESYIEKVSRKYHFEYGKSRMWGSIGWAAATFFTGYLFNINPHINFWIASASAAILFVIVLSIKVFITEEEAKLAQSLNLSYALLLFRQKKVWCFMLYIAGVTCMYNVYDQQFPRYFASIFPTEAQGNEWYGYLNSFQVFLEAGMMFLSPFIVNKIGAKNALILAGVLATFRIGGSGFVSTTLAISGMKLIHAVELPLMLIAIFKYLAFHFDTRLSSVLYLVGFQFISQVGASFYAPIVGVLYDAQGFAKTYIYMGVWALVFTCIACFTLSKTPPHK